MSKDEIAHRMREQARRKVDFLRFCTKTAIDQDGELDELIARHGGSLRSYLEHGPARRFYPSIQDREILKSFPEWSDRTIRNAGTLCEHRVNLLGHTDLALGGSIDWHRDPVTGAEWPRRFCGDYDLVHESPGDAKVIHELNRHQHLPRLAKAFFITGDEPYAREAIAQMESWIEQNPRWDGVHWHSSLEIGIRSISWLWTIFLLLQARSLDEPALRRIVKSLLAQFDQIYRYPSLYASPNTHLLGEAAALFIAGVVFRDLPRAKDWQEFGAGTLANEMQRQINAEGIHCELSSYYHCYATDFYLQVLTLAKRNRVACPEWMWTRLEQMFDFVMHITRPDGTIPFLGDDDGGRALMLASEDYRSYRDGLCSGAILFGRGGFKYQAAGFYEESLWLLGDDAWPIFDSLSEECPHDLSKPYPKAGYFVQRSGWEANDSHLIFDCGGLGLPTGGHGHADALAFTLFSGGRDLLIDPGTSVYNCSPQWRTYFRSTRAHNTVVVDGHDQSEPSGTFAWKTKASARIRNHFSLADIDYIDGEHDGYVLKAGVTHRRRLLYIRPSYWVVLDDFQGAGMHDFDFLYHFAPGAQLTVFGEEDQCEVDCRAEIGNAGLQTFLYSSERIRAEVECGERDPIQGWSSQRYGERQPSSVLRASVRGVAPVSLMSFVRTAKEPTQSRRFKANNNHTIAAAIRDGENDDIAVMAVEDGDLHLLDCVMRGEFFWLRLQEGNLRRLLAVNARSFSYAGETVFDDAEVSPYVQAYFWDDGIVIERGEGKVYVRDLRDRQFQRH